MTLAAAVLSLLFMASTAVANTVTYYSSSGCDSVTGSCNNIGRTVCCAGSGNAVSISKQSGQIGQGWIGGGCSNNVCTAGGAGTICCVGSTTWTGGSWDNGNGQNDDSNAVESPKCTSIMYPNAFGFKNGSHGAWEIREEDLLAGGKTRASFDSLWSAFESVPMDQKIQWLQEHDATHTIDDQPMYTVEANVDKVIKLFPEL